MINVSVLDVAKAVGGLLIGDENTYVNGVSIDSRKIDARNLYIPVVGNNNDGHNYISDVVKRGIACFLLQEDHERPDVLDTPYIIVKDTVKALQRLAAYYIRTINPYIIGVTGSNGKTSAKDMLHALMSKKYKTAKTTGNHNNEIGVPLSILNFDNDIKCAVIEMGMEHHGDIDLLCSIAKPDAALITNVGTAHMVNLNNSKNEIAQAKLEIYNNLSQGGYLVYNKESKELEEELEKIITSNKEVVPFGVGSENTIDENIKFVNGSSIFKCSKLEEEVCINTLGRHYVYNALGCITIALKEGVEKKEIIKALKKVKFEKMRCEIIKVGKCTIIDDSYKSNPESVKAAIDLVDSMNAKRKVVCLSDMLDLGKNEKQMHKDLGKYINKTSITDVVCTGELAYHILDKVSGRFFETKEECSKYLEKYINTDSVILVKGSRATEMDKVVKELKKLA